MNTLVLETTLPTITVALVQAETQKVWALRDGEPRPSARLQGHLETVLQEAGLTPPDLAHIVVTRGPGSFTGARMGLAVAQALHRALGIPVTSLTTLEALALSAQAKTPVTVLIDSQGAEVFVQNFSADGTALDDPQVLDPASVHIPPGAHVAGDGVKKCGLTGQATLQVNPLALATRGGEQGGDHPFQPFYLKPLSYRKLGGA